MLSFEEIEDCFPNGVVSLEEGWTGVTAQWLHDFAHAVAAKEREACAKPPEILFDGFTVLQALDENARKRTSPENVSDVLDAVVRLMRSNV